MVHSAGARISSNWDFVRDLNPLPWGSEKSPGAEKDISNLFSKPSKPIAETAMATVQTERNTKENKERNKNYSGKERIWKDVVWRRAVKKAKGKQKKLIEKCLHARERESGRYIRMACERTAKNWNNNKKRY